MIKVGTWKVTAGRNVKRCGFTHVTPAWWPRLVLTWEDAPRYENGRWWPARTVNGCIRHTRAAHRWLTFMGTPSKIGPEREAQAHIALTEVLAAAAECRYCGESITELSPGVWAWTADYGDPDERTWCDDSPDWKHARDELLAAHAAHDLPVIGCVACEAIDPGTWRERYSDYAAAHDLTAGTTAT